MRSIKRHIRIGLVALTTCFNTASGALPQVPEEAERAAVWRNSRMAELVDLHTLPHEQRIPELGRYVRQLSRASYRDTPELRDVLGFARKELLSVPGHAEYYADRMKELQDEMEGAGVGTPRYKELQSKYLNEKMYGFETLKHLPSPETVRVLGELLFDDRGKAIIEDGKPPTDQMAKSRAMSWDAQMTLTELIDDPPIPPRGYFLEADLEPWRLWYEQVKAGNRTFRFKGDPQEYTLEGPVPVRLEPSVGRTSSRPDAAAPGKQMAAEEAPAVPVVALIATTLLLAGALGYFIRSRRQRS